jgi:Uma2 family endonuclease
MTQLVTAEELLTISDTECRHELVAGEVRKRNFHGWRHGAIAHNVVSLVGLHVVENQVGLGFAGGTGFVLHRNPDTVLAPDYAFVANENKSKGTIDDGYWPCAPDLAVEVLEPSDTAAEVSERVNEWLRSGSAAVWIVDPKLRTVTIYGPTTSAQVVPGDEILIGDPIVPGFFCQVDKFFQ